MAHDSFCAVASAFLYAAVEAVQTTDPNSLERRKAIDNLWDIRTPHMRDARAMLARRAEPEIEAVEQLTEQLHDLTVEARRGGNPVWWEKWHALNRAVRDAEPFDAGGVAEKPADEGGTKAGGAKRAGRLPKDQSHAKRMALLARRRQHPTLDPATLGKLERVSESTARRWIDEEEKKYRESAPASGSQSDED